MVKWLVKRYVRKILNGFLSGKRREVGSVVECIGRYRQKLDAVLAFVDGLKEAVADAELTEAELEKTLNEANGLVESLFAKGG